MFAPRRYGKSSLVLRAAQEALAKGVLVAYCDLMKTPRKERFGGALAKTIYEDLVSPDGQALEKASALFRGFASSRRSRSTPMTQPALQLRGRPRPRAESTTRSRAARAPRQDRRRAQKRTALIFDEFQEVLELDQQFPNLMRAVFQTQPEVAHIYLGSRRHVQETIFNDKNEPFWRSAKRVEIGVIPTESSAPTSSAGSTARTAGFVTTPSSASSASPAVIPTAPRSSPTSSGDRSRKGTSPTWRTSNGR